MPKFRYKGEDKNIGRFGPVGHGSVLEITQAEILTIDGTQFERVADSEPAVILAFGSIPYEPDVTALSEEESNKERAKGITSESMRAAGGTPGPRDKHGKLLSEKEAERVQEAAAKEEAAKEKERLATAAGHPGHTTGHVTSTQPSSSHKR